MDIPKTPVNPPADFGANPEEYLEQVTESGSWLPEKDSWATPEILRNKIDRVIEVTDKSEIF